MKNLVLALLLFVNISFAQDAKVGGPCEGCEAIYESPVPFGKIEIACQVARCELGWKKATGDKRNGIYG